MLGHWTQCRCRQCRLRLHAWHMLQLRYLHDLRWVTGWQSVYGYGNRAENTEEHFIQIWVAQPQYTGLMAHLLQQGAVLSMSFQPFEVHLPYLLHFLDSFGLGGMRELVVDPARVALRGELPEQALSTFPWHPLWASKLGSSARERLLCCRGQKPWWCDKAASETRLAWLTLAYGFIDLQVFFLSSCLVYSVNIKYIKWVIELPLLWQTCHRLCQAQIRASAHHDL